LSIFSPLTFLLSNEKLKREALTSDAPFYPLFGAEEMCREAEL